MDEPGSQSAEVLGRLVGAAEHLASVGRWRNDLVSGSVVWSDEVFRIFGLEPKARAPSVDVTLTLFHPDDQSHLSSAFERCCTTGQPYEVENRIVRPGGEMRTVVSKGEAERSAEGAVVAVRGVFMDISERVRVEAELRRTRGFLDTLLDDIPVMLLAKTTGEHRYVLWNRMAEEVTGLSRHQVLGRTAHDVFPPDEAARTAELDRLTLQSARPLVSEGVLHTAHQTERRVVTKRVVLSDQHGRPEFTAAIIEDVTEQKRSAEALTRALEQAEAANRAKSEFLANMSHEIRTPLNGVLGVASVLAAGELSAEQREAVGIIEASATTLGRLLSDILDVARMESGRLQIATAPFDLDELVAGVTRLCRGEADRKGVRFHIEIAESARGWVDGDSVRVGQILINLLSNALKFTERGEVSLHVRAVVAEEQNLYEFSVRDTGIGFSAQAKARLFDRFEQADGSITRRFGGTGLGLAISCQLAKLMGGTLTAESEEGVGSTFVVNLALTRVAPVGRLEAGPEPIACGAESLRVLLADDHAVNRRVVELMLQGSAFEVTSVVDGLEAIEALAAQSFDVVLMDMQMPVMDGLTALRRLRERERGQSSHPTPVIMLSANAMPEHLRAAFEAGADGYVTKPFQSATFLAELNRLLSSAPLETDSDYTLSVSHSQH